MADPIETLIARLNGGTDAASYRANNEALLARLGDLEKPFAIRDEADYARAREIKRMLCSLSCFTTNTQHPADARVWALESVWARALWRYNRRHLIKDESTRLVARYLLWRRYFPHVDGRAAFVLARRAGILCRTAASTASLPNLVVIGLERAVGDNLFTVDRRGREHRRYAKTIGRQAFRVVQTLPWQETAAETFIASLPALDATYEITSIGDFKHGARGSAFDREAKHRVHTLLQNVPESELVLELSSRSLANTIDRIAA